MQKRYSVMTTFGSKVRTYRNKTAKQAAQLMGTQKYSRVAVMSEDIHLVYRQPSADGAIYIEQVFSYMNIPILIEDKGEITLSMADMEVTEILAEYIKSLAKE